jgi:pre-mRNA-processing factor 40
MPGLPVPPYPPPHAGWGASPLAPPAAPPGGGAPPVRGGAEWAQHTAPDGRSYYYNATTRASSWEVCMRARTRSLAAAWLPGVCACFYL